LKILDGSSNPIFVESIHGGVVDRVFRSNREVLLFNPWWWRDHK
jgi:hypothetical protein